MRKRQKEITDTYEAQWDGGRGSHHPDYDPTATGEGVTKASRCASHPQWPLALLLPCNVNFDLSASRPPKRRFPLGHCCGRGRTPTI